MYCAIMIKLLISLMFAYYISYLGNVLRLSAYTNYSVRQYILMSHCQLCNASNAFKDISSGLSIYLPLYDLSNQAKTVWIS